MVGMTNASQGMDTQQWAEGNYTGQVTVYSDDFVAQGTGGTAPYTQTISFAAGSSHADEHLRTMTYASTPIISLNVPNTVEVWNGTQWISTSLDASNIGSYEKEYGYISKIETSSDAPTPDTGKIIITCLKKKPSVYRYMILNIKKGGL